MGRFCCICFHVIHVGDSFGYHSDMSLTTRDQDNDANENNCADNRGAWWFKTCHYAHLNGLYLDGPNSSYGDGVNWYHWKGYTYSLKATSMMIRRRRWDNYLVRNLSSVLWCPLRFPHKTMFRSSFLLVFFVGASMPYLRYLCLFTYSGVQHILFCVFAWYFSVLCLVYPMLPVSLDCLFRFL